MIADPRALERRRTRSRARRPQLLPRTLIVISGLVAVGCTRLATDDPIPALEILIAGLALVCASLPDNHLGLLAVLLIGFNWVLAVDDPTTPWSIGAAISLAVLHTSMAAASVAPLAAPWTRAMYLRWIRRLLTVAAATIPTWALAAVFSRTDIPGSAALLVAALLALAVGAVWARHGDLRVNPPRWWSVEVCTTDSTAGGGVAWRDGIRGMAGRGRTLGLNVRSSPHPTWMWNA